MSAMPTKFSIIAMLHQFFNEFLLSAMPLRRWLVGCFGLNGPLRQYFSLYRAAPREREKEMRSDR